MEISTILISVILLLLTIIVYKKYSLKKAASFRNMGIPGPKPWLFMGNFIELMRQGFVQSYSNMYKRYENERMYVIDEPGNAEFLIIKDLDMMRDICIKNFNSFVDRRKAFDVEAYDTLMTNLKGEHWRHVRNTVSPTFSSGKLKRMFYHIEETSRLLLSNLKQACEEGKDIELKDISSCFSMDVIASVGFGVKVDTLNNKDNDFVIQAKKILTGFTGGLIILAYVCPPLGHLLEKMGFDVFNTAPAKYFSSFVDAAMSNRQKGESRRHDFLQLVVDAEETQENVKSGLESENGQNERKGLTNADIQGTALVFILAGYETTATAMSMLMFNLANNPECREKLQEEIDSVLNGKFPTYENVPELTYLDMCINESLRMFPPGFVLDRECTEDCEIGGVLIPKGAHVAFPVMAIQNDPRLWPEPTKFDPERFTAANKEGRHPFAYLPFGHGPRNCIGMRLALLEIKVATATILQEMSPVPCEKSVYPPKIEKFAYKAADGLWVKFEKRSKI